MPGKLRTLAASDVLRILGRFGFQAVSQRGSHIKLRRYDTGGTRVTLVIPNHKQIKPGTLHAIYREACRAVPEMQLRPYFFSE